MHAHIPWIWVSLKERIPSRNYGIFRRNFTKRKKVHESSSKKIFRKVYKLLCEKVKLEIKLFFDAIDKNLSFLAFYMIIYTSFERSLRVLTF